MRNYMEIQSIFSHALLWIKKYLSLTTENFLAKFPDSITAELLYLATFAVFENIYIKDKFKKNISNKR